MAPATVHGAASAHPDLATLIVGRDIMDREGLLTTRLDASPGATYVIRPDQHLAARMRMADPARIRQAVARIMGRAADAGTPPRASAMAGGSP